MYYPIDHYTGRWTLGNGHGVGTATGRVDTCFSYLVLGAGGRRRSPGRGNKRRKDKAHKDGLKTCAGAATRTARSTPHTK